MSAGFWLLLMTALTISPAPVTAAVLLAAAMHEGGHLAALSCFGVPVEGVRLGVMGAVLYARGAVRLSYGRELCVTLAGPAANLLCALSFAALSSRLSWDWALLFAGAHAVLGVYNLVPIPPLDGARALYLVIAYCFGPLAGARAVRVTGLVFALALAGLGAYLLLRYGAALFFLAAMGLLLPQLGLAKTERTV